MRPPPTVHQQIRHRIVATLPQVHLAAIHQRVKWLAGEREQLHDFGQRDGNGMNRPTDETLIQNVPPLVQEHQRHGRAILTRLVHHVVHVPRKSVHRP